MTVPLRMILFDLDGTLVQTREASWLVFEQVNRRFGLGVNSPEEFYALSETNLFRALGEVCNDPNLEREVRSFFFELLREQYRPSVIPGMRVVVRNLASRYPLAVLSLNAMSAIRHVEPDKADTINRILEDQSYGLARRGTPSYDERSGYQAGDIVLITDTVGDVKAAVSAGSRAVGVAWGMHKREQLTKAGAEFVALWPEELLTYFQAAEGPGGTH
jgi:phosphoglycolate phosphatase